MDITDIFDSCLISGQDLSIVYNPFLMMLQKAAKPLLSQDIASLVTLSIPYTGVSHQNQMFDPSKTSVQLLFSFPEDLPF